jgi:putative oxidoreductase
MNDSIKSSFLLAGRILLALMFVISGFGKLANAGPTAQFMATGGLPEVAALAVLVGLFEVLAGIALIVGFKAQWAALALGAFTVLASLLFHAYWSAPADQQYVQQLMFLKNLAVVGGMLAVAAFGAGGFSVDAMFRRR